MAEAESNIGSETTTDAEVERLLNAPAYIEVGQMGQLEECATSNVLGQSRRCTLGVLTQPVKRLIEISREQPDVYAELVGAVAAFKSHAQGLLEFATTAEIRLMIADEREVVAEAAK